MEAEQRTIEFLNRVFGNQITFRTCWKRLVATLSQLHAEANRLGRLLKAKNVRIVFAESCTGGLISAALTRIAGISAYYCGSAVVYQVETKADWLGVSTKLLEKPGPVSPEVAREMAEHVLAKTPHADISASVTGFLGPESPTGKDGLVFCAVARRGVSGGKKAFKTVVHRLELDAPAGNATHGARVRLRVRRQIEAAMFVVARVCETLESR